MAKFREETGLSYDDVLMVPKLGMLAKREQADISSTFVGDIILGVPIISAPMSSVTEWEMAAAVDRAGGAGIIHRFMSIEDQIKQFSHAAIDSMTGRISCALGIHDTQERLDSLYNVGCNVFCLDVAHAHHIEIEKVLTHLKRASDTFLIVGNVATADGAGFLDSFHVDGIKVGIGPGAACVTREVTGFGMPQLSAIMEVAEELKGTNVSIIADGGIKNSGDIAKAIAAGADAVMLGRLLAGADEAPKPGEYFGMASKQVNGHNAPEGAEGLVQNEGPVKEIIKRLAWGLRSAVSYSGGMNLDDLRDNAEFIKVTPYTALESGTRI